jgi:hypothetical protein
LVVTEIVDNWLLENLQWNTLQWVSWLNNNLILFAVGKIEVGWKAASYLQ